MPSLHSFLLSRNFYTLWSDKLPPPPFEAWNEELELQGFPLCPPSERPACVWKKAYTYASVPNHSGLPQAGLPRRPLSEKSEPQEEKGGRLRALRNSRVVGPSGGFGEAAVSQVKEQPFGTSPPHSTLAWGFIITASSLHHFTAQTVKEAGESGEGGQQPGENCGASSFLCFSWLNRERIGGAEASRVSSGRSGECVNSWISEEEAGAVAGQPRVSVTSWADAPGCLVWVSSRGIACNNRNTTSLLQALKVSYAAALGANMKGKQEPGRRLSPKVCWNLVGCEERACACQPWPCGTALVLVVGPNVFCKKSVENWGCFRALLQSINAAICSSGKVWAQRLVSCLQVLFSDCFYWKNLLRRVACSPTQFLLSPAHISWPPNCIFYLFF